MNHNAALIVHDLKYNGIPWFLSIIYTGLHLMRTIHSALIGKMEFFHRGIPLKIKERMTLEFTEYGKLRRCCLVI